MESGPELLHSCVMFGMPAFLALLSLSSGAPPAPPPPELFAGESQALAAIAKIGREWSLQTEAPREGAVYRGPPPADRPRLRLSSRERQFTFRDGRRVLLDWNRQGELDEVQLLDPACWAVSREALLRNLVDASGASRERLQLLHSTMSSVFDRGAKVWEVDAQGSAVQFVRLRRDGPCIVYVRRKPYGTPAPN